MRKLHGKRIFLFALTLFYLILPGSAGAQVLLPSSEKNILDSGNNSVHFQSGILKGTANEYVYNGDHTLSRLIWEIDNLFMAGGGFSINKNGLISMHADLWLKMMDGSGEMDDYDWFVEDLPWTHWSHHSDTTVTKATILDLCFEFKPDYFQYDYFGLSGFTGYRFSYFKWEARGGSYIYSSTNAAKTELTGFRDLTGEFEDGEPAISYRQTYNLPYLGLGIEGRFGNFHLSSKLSGSLFVFGKAVDNHHMRDFTTYAYFYMGRMFSSDLSAEYFFTKHSAFKASFSYSVYGNLRGDTEYHSDGSVDIYKNSEGADFKSTMFSVSYQHSF
ncbi:MAG: omptin family outer membrane protease [Spirochaetia bacterium]|jgi:outer membrane protease|nr:omptin family outer membrane protease [Spirochaetia bacterium]